MPHIFGDSPGKRVVREQWNTPLLRHLHDRYGFTYRYFGLPGPDIIDIDLWRDMISDVIAFEVPAEGKKSDERKHINKLRENLELKGVPNITYYGPFEQVVLLGRDFDGQEYHQGQVITLYNLDFCGEIGKKITAADGQEYYRVEALRQVFRDQIACYNQHRQPSCFIVLMTVRNQMHARVLRDRISACRPRGENFINACEAVIPIVGDSPLIGTHAWAIKTIICTTIGECLRGNNISALFFPLVKYEGVPTRIEVDGAKQLIPSPMLHLMLFCKFQHPREATGISVPSSPFDLKSIAVHAGSLMVSPEPGEHIDGHISPVEYFESLKREILREDECLVG